MTAERQPSADRPFLGKPFLDHASTWPLRPQAARAIADAAQVAWADPERRYADARAARDLLDRATDATARALGAPADGVVWTGSGTEAVQLAVLGPARAAVRRGDPRRHLVVSAVEHSAVLRGTERLRDEAGFRLDVVGVDRAGVVDPQAVRALLTDNTLAVHVQHANHEVGALQPVHEVSLACRDVGALLHVDACQTVGQLGVTLDQLGADLLSASAVKFGGPPGVGLLLVGPRGRLAPVVEGDERQRGRRSGRLDVAAVAGSAVALQVAIAAMESERSPREVARRRLRAALPAAVSDLAVHGPLPEAHPGIVAVSALYVDGEALVARLDERGWSVHSGSSCATTSGEPSHVLVAMEALTHGHVRISFGPDLDDAGVDAFVADLAEVVSELRSLLGRRRAARH